MNGVYKYNFTELDVKLLNLYMSKYMHSVYLEEQSGQGVKDIFQLNTNNLFKLIEIANKRYSNRNTNIISISVSMIDKNIQDISELYHIEDKHAGLPYRTLNLASNIKKISQEEYSQLALTYATKYGIITYKVQGKYMIYNQNYRNREFMGNKWVSNPYTMQRKVDLSTGRVESKQLQRLQKNGWDNV